MGEIFDSLLRQSNKVSFDPEGSGYDYDFAIKAGITRDATGHLPSSHNHKRSLNSLNLIIFSASKIEIHLDP